MSFLPVIGRELRVAARKPSTFRLRTVAAATALVIGLACMLLNTVFMRGTVGVGTMLFYALTWICLVTGLSAGLFLTSDCLSEEKREGTLGLLFLTDLRGYDVALGKLLATSLRGFYALLALFPILALTLLLGGVSGEQYWKSVLALVNALFLSLAAGLAVSAISRDSQRAMSASLFLLLLLAAGGPLADQITAAVTGRNFVAVLSLASPAYILRAASAWGRSSFWTALAVTQVIGWLLLAFACAVVPHTWQDRKRARAWRSSGFAYAWRYGGTGRRLRLRRKLLDLQPVAWLACRERWQSLGLWTIALLITGGLVVVLAGRLSREYWLVWNWVGGVFMLILYLWAASQACRFFVEARRSGLLELLLATPLKEGQMIAGQWLALWRMFGVPVLLLLSVHVVGSTLSQLEFQRAFTRSAAMTSSVTTNQNGVVTSSTVVVSGTSRRAINVQTNRVSMIGALQNTGTAWQTFMTVAGAAVAAVTTLANLLALCWFGMWMGLTSRTANLATLKTIAFVQVIPAFVIVFAANMLIGVFMSALVMRTGSPQVPGWFSWWPLVSAVFSGMLAVAKDVVFILWSRKKLRTSLREQASFPIGQPRFTGPVPPVPTLAAPPTAAVAR